MPHGDKPKTREQARPEGSAAPDRVSSPGSEAGALDGRIDHFHYSVTESHSSASVDGAGEPEVDVREDNDTFWVRVALPGIDPAAVRVELTPHQLVITAENTGHEAQGREATAHRRSRYGLHGRFHYVYRVPAAIDENSVSAKWQHGMLEVTLPKRPVHPAAPIQIPIALSDSPSTVPGTETPGASTAAPGFDPVLPGSVSPDSVTPDQREGNPGGKLGAEYHASGSDDHVAQTRSSAVRRENADAELVPTPSPVIGGSTNAAEPGGDQDSPIL